MFFLNVEQGKWGYNGWGNRRKEELLGEKGRKGEGR